MRLLMSGILMLSLVQVAAAASSSLSGPAQKELKASKENTKKCKMIIIKAAQKDNPKDAERARAQSNKTIGEIDSFCKSGAKWFEGCKVLSSSSSSCGVVRIDGETRLDEGARKTFPKDFR